MPHGCSIGSCARRAGTRPHPRSRPSKEFLVLDIVCVLGVIALFVTIGLIGTAVERL